MNNNTNNKGRAPTHDVATVSQPSNMQRVSRGWITETLPAATLI